MVAITPASGFVKPFPALLIGLLAGVFCFYMVTAVKSKFGYDDTLDAFGVHGAAGTLGALLTGVFATRAVNDALKDTPLGWVDGHPMQVAKQAVGVAIACVLAIAGTFFIPKVVDAVVGVRASAYQEMEGLDLSMHGEKATRWRPSRSTMQKHYEEDGSHHSPKRHGTIAPMRQRSLACVHGYSSLA